MTSLFNLYTSRCSYEIFLNNDKIKHEATMTLNNITYAALFEKFLNGLNINEIKIMCTSEIIFHGTSIRKNLLFY